MQFSLPGKAPKWTPWLLGVAAVGVVAVSGTAVWSIRRSTPASGVTELTVPVSAKTVTVRISASATVVPTQTVNLSPKNAGRVAQLLVEQGDRVRQGQVIARMESKDLEAERVQAEANLQQARANLALLQAGTRPEEVDQAQANVDLAQGQVVDAQSRLSLAQTRLGRNQALASEGAIARDRLDEVANEERSARANLEQAQARLNNALKQRDQRQNGPRIQEIQQAEAQVKAAAGRLQAVENQLEDTQIRAPFAGIITQRYATEGAFVTPTTSASTTSQATSPSIVALARGLEVLAKVPEVDIGQIKLGQEVEIKADAYPDRVFKGRVRLIAPEAVIDQNVTSFQVRVEILEGLEELRSGMNIDVQFLGTQLNNALIVPTVAIVTDRGQTGVLVPGRNNKPRFQPVTIGATIGNQTQVLQGVKAGDPVFVELPEGQKLEDVIKSVQQKQ